MTTGVSDQYYKVAALVPPLPFFHIVLLHQSFKLVALFVFILEKELKHLLLSETYSCSFLPSFVFAYFSEASQAS